MKRLNYINRLRTTFGFGVHSAFAYYFIMNVLREKNHYYAYDVIDTLPIPPKTARMLFRTRLFFSGANFYAIPDDSSLNKIVSIAEKESKTGVSAIKFGEDTEIIFLLLGRKKANNLILQEQLRNMTFGMAFINHRKHAIIVKDRNLPRKDFELFF